MNKKFIYAKPGSNRVSHEKKRREELNGAVRMDIERPTQYAICVDIGNGDGKWIEPKFVFLIRLKEKYHLINLRLKLFLHSNWPLILVVIVLFSSSFFLDSGSLLSLWISLLASILFYIVNDVYPRKKRAKYESLKISSIIKELNELKNFQYINLGYLNHLAKKDFLNDGGVERDKGIDENKAIILINLMEQKKNSREIKYWDSNLEDYMGKKYQTYGEYFVDAHMFLKKKLVELQEIIKPELFPNLYKPVNDIAFNLRKASFHKDDIWGFTPYEYVKRHFQYIEFLECLYQEECSPYIGFIPIPLNIILSYDEDFVRRSYHPNLDSIPESDR